MEVIPGKKFAAAKEENSKRKKNGDFPGFGNKQTESIQDPKNKLLGEEK